MPWSPAVLVAALAVVATPVAHAQTGPALKEVPLFSASPPGAPPAPWEIVKVNERKKLTEFRFVSDGGTTVVHAVSEAGASGVGVPLDHDLKAAPNLSWRWKVAGLIEGADHSVGSKEDSPARIIFTFDGDKSKLPFADRTTMNLASKAYGRDLPYATLMYVWANDAPVGTAISNPHTKRIQMVVASSGKAGVGQWQSIKRNVRDDYKRVFGEDPGPVKSITVFTDSDNTGTSAEAWYGDLRFAP
jgi:hypothetical protein